MSELLATSIVLVIPDEEAPLSGDDAIRDPAQEAPAGLEIFECFAHTFRWIPDNDRPKGASRFRDDGATGSRP